MFIQTEVTPNPATLKFLPGRPVLESGTFEALDDAQAERSPLAKALMELPGVSGVFLAPDFISVTKDDGEWQQLRPAVLGIVTEFALERRAAAAAGLGVAARGVKAGSGTWHLFSISVTYLLRRTLRRGLSPLAIFARSAVITFCSHAARSL